MTNAAVSPPVIRSVAGSAYPMEGFKSGLRDLGWVEGEGVRFDVRAAEGQLHLLPDFASEMVSPGSSGSLS